MPPTAQAERIEARLIDALRTPPPGGLSRTALIRAATGDYKAGAAVLDKLIAAEVITKNSDNVLELTDPQPEAETPDPDLKAKPVESSPWDDRATDIEQDIELLTKRVSNLAEAVKAMSGQMTELAAAVGQLAEIVAAVTDVSPAEDDRSIPEQSITLHQAADRTLLDLTPEGMTVLDRMSPEQRTRAEEHLSKYATAPQVEPSGPDFWANAQEPDYAYVAADAENFWA